MNCECNTLADSALCWLTVRLYVRQTFLCLEGAVFHLTAFTSQGAWLKALFSRYVLAGISQLPKMSECWLCFPIDLYSTFLKHYICSTKFPLRYSIVFGVTHICFAVTVLHRSHPLAGHDWSIMYNACTLLVKLLFSHYFQQVLKQYENKSKPEHFRQFRNPGQDIFKEDVWST